jgi:hypothetical protein
MKSNIQLFVFPPVSTKEFNDCFIKWQESNKELRFGQYFCNHFNITDQLLFYEKNTAMAIDLILNRYMVK